VLPDKIAYTEASSFACAGFTVETYTRIVHKMWSSDEALKGSTYRELKAVLIAFFSLQEVFQNRLVNIYTDNQNVVRITNTGSMKSELQSLAIEIFNLCIIKNISLEVEWIPREQNQTAVVYKWVSLSICGGAMRSYRK
jgi:ribonuclease HI